jgi:hypothetical protein
MTKEKINKGFASDKVTIGAIEVGGKVNGEFLYNGPKKDLESITKGCGSCTTLFDYREENGKTVIPFQYKDDHVLNAGLENSYPGRVINVTKSLTVFFKDGLPLEVPSETGPGTMRNYKDKEYVNLTFRVDVKL